MGMADHHFTYDHFSLSFLQLALEMQLHVKWQHWIARSDVGEQRMEFT